MLSMLALTLLARATASRLDAALVTRGLCSSRASAKAAITAGQVTVNGAVITKAAHACGDAAELTLAGGAENRYVSRAGEKLRAALEAFDIDVNSAAVLDIGASTGGFTDCLLDAGAASVVCVDNGHGQLHPSLAADARVTSLEGVNARNLSASQLPQAAYEAIVVDVSFISLLLVLPALWPLLEAASPRARLVALVKPQFEAVKQIGDEGRLALNKGKGVLKDEELQARLLEGVASFATSELEGCAVVGTIDSPIVGGDGNREFLLSLAHASHEPKRGPWVGRPGVRTRGLAAEEAVAAAAEEAAAEAEGLAPVEAVRRRPSSAARAAAYARSKDKLSPEGPNARAKRT